MATETPPIDEVTEDAQAPVSVQERLFRYSAWVAIGPGAEDCEDVFEDETEPRNDCANPLHFHAWCRLPNQFQHDTLREKALAAKGRRVRQLRDPATDAHDALEEALDTLFNDGEKGPLVQEISVRDQWEDYAEAAREVGEIEDGTDDDEQPILPFAHILDDQQRLGELEAAGEETDELIELRTHARRYIDLVSAKVDELLKPKEAALEALDLSDLVDKVRAERIRREANTHFMTVYSRHEWAMCVYTKPNGPRRFASVEQVEEVAPEVYEALRMTFDDLEQSQNLGVVSGNS